MDVFTYILPKVFTCFKWNKSKDISGNSITNSKYSDSRTVVNSKI